MRKIHSIVIIMVLVSVNFFAISSLFTETAKADWSYLTLRPTGQGTYTSWIDEPDVGSNHFQNVDDVVADDDTTRLKSNTFHAGDSWVMENTTQTEPIFSVTQWVRAKADEERTLDIGFNNGGIYYDSIYPVASTYTNYSIVWLECPWTSAEWTWSDVNNMEFYISRLGAGEYIYVTQAYIIIKYGTEPPIPPTPPTLSNETPSNGATAIRVNLPRIGVTINDTDGDSFNWTIGGDNITVNSSTGDTDGIKYADIIGPLEYYTDYTWWVNASDDDGYINESYTFRTEHAPTGASAVYVNGGYNSGTPGWDYDHFDNIQDAVSAVSNDGIVLVYAGTYTENIHIEKSLTITGGTSTIVDGAGDTVFHINANDVHFKTLTIQNGQPGIYLDHADNFTITRCKFINNNQGTEPEPTGGIWFDTSSNAVIYENDFTYSYINIYHDRNCTYNWIYHNNFLEGSDGNDDPPGPTPDPKTNRWNDTYPSGGNYHSEIILYFPLTDDFSGPNQDIPGGDGILDFSWFCGRGNKDWYPLKYPYVLVRLATTIDFTWSPLYPKPKETVTFTALTEKSIVNWRWEFGDITTGAGKTTTKTYSKAGYYMVSLKVIDNKGYHNTITKRIFIVPKGPFIPDPQPPKYPGYTIPEMYDLLHATNLNPSQSKVKVMVIDSGVIPKTYNGIDLSWIQMKHATGWSDGLDANGHGCWTNYAVSYILKSKLPNSKQISYKIFGADGQSTNEMLLQALDDAKRMGVDVVSISAGVIGNPNDQFCRKVQELASDGIMVICAVGNFGPYTSTILSPGCSLYSLSVAGSDPQWYGDTMTPERKAGVLNLADDTICEFSSRGPVTGVYPKPDVTAPAESITGPWASNGVIVERTVSGTSMSTPLVAGSIAVIIGQNKDLIDQVKTARFWDKGAVVVALQESIRESCYVKGGVNDWGAGIVQFDKVSKIYAGKLQGLVVMSYLILFLPILLIIILIVSIYLIRRGTSKKSVWGKGKRKSTWGKSIRRSKSSWKW